MGRDGKVGTVKMGTGGTRGERAWRSVPVPPGRTWRLLVDGCWASRLEGGEGGGGGEGKLEASGAAAGSHR
jgi:hypothetical protein